MPFVQATNVHVHVLIPVWDARMFAGFCNCKNKRQEESNTLESEKANFTSAKLDDTALPSDFDEDDSKSDSESDIE